MPRRDKALERVDVTQVAGVAERAVERGDFAQREGRTVGTKVEMWRTQQSDCRTASIVAPDEIYQ